MLSENNYIRNLRAKWSKCQESVMIRIVTLQIHTLTRVETYQWYPHQFSSLFLQTAMNRNAIVFFSYHLLSFSFFHSKWPGFIQQILKNTQHIKHYYLLWKTCSNRLAVSLISQPWEQSFFFRRKKRSNTTSFLFLANDHILDFFEILFFVFV